MDHSIRFFSFFVFLSLAACGGVANTDSGGDGDGDADGRRWGGPGDGDDVPRPTSGDGDGVSATTCSPGEESYCFPPPECSEAHQECLPTGDGWGRCICDVISGVGGSPPTVTVDSPDSDFIVGGRGTVGGWDGYLFTVAEAGSTISPSEIVGSNACVSGILAAGYQEWAMVAWNIGQVIDPETFQGLTPHAISPGGTGVEVQVLNNAGSGLRVELHSDEAATESWCAPIPPAGGVIPWADFRKECWAPGGAAYDGVTPISTVGVLTFSGSDTMPTPFDYCVLHLGPVL